MNKEIILKGMILKNFKGIRSLEVQFSPRETVVKGENGSGKTTVLDAFLWLLFGKDSTGRSDNGVSGFNIKTLDENGNPILHLEHEVTGILLVNGIEVTLKRAYLEKWDRAKGNVQESLKNHFTEFYVNGVKLSTKREYDAEVSSIIPEDVFKMVTNPLYFPSLNPLSQKAMLLDMAGNITDQDVAGLKPEYLELLSSLNGRSLEQFKKEIAAKKKVINDELDQLPGRIDTAQTLMPDPEDWNTLEKELSSKKAKLSEIENQITDKSKLVESEYEKKNVIQKQIGSKRLERSSIENRIKNEANDANNKARNVIRDMDYKIQDVSTNISNFNSQVQTVTNQIGSIENELSTLRGQYKDINAEQLQYPAGTFVCPTCKRLLDADDIEAKQNEMLANFNQNKSQRLQDNQTEGKKKAAKIKELQEKKYGILAKISDLNNELTTLKGQKQYQEENLPAAQDTNSIIQADQNWVKLGNEINDLENQLNIDIKPVDTTELQESKHVLAEAIDELKKRLNKREAIERAQKLINEYEDSKSVNGQALSDLDRMEFIALDFQKAKDSELMNRINGMFELVSFSFIDEQLNGGEKVTCVCTIEGTPYPDLNNAKKINAGLDIINAICKNKGLAAPIFIDNRESINNLLPTISQVINLCVSKDPKLVIE